MVVAVGVVIGADVGAGVGAGVVVVGTGVVVVGVGVVGTGTTGTTHCPDVGKVQRLVKTSKIKPVLQNCKFDSPALQMK